MKGYIFSFLVIFCLGGISMFLVPETWKRSFKTYKSEWVGLNRTISIYSHNGELMKTFNGSADVVFDGNRVLFDMDGKRTIIHNAIIIIEEN